MLTGTELGKAIAGAIKRKGITQKALAQAFKVSPPSIQDWLKRGTIKKERLPDLWAYFADVCGPEYWGLSAFPFEPVQGPLPAGSPGVEASRSLPQAIPAPFRVAETSTELDTKSLESNSQIASLWSMLDAFLKKVPAQNRELAGQTLANWARSPGQQHWARILMELGQIIPTRSAQHAQPIDQASDSRQEAKPIGPANDPRRDPLTVASVIADKYEDDERRVLAYQLINETREWMREISKAADKDVNSVPNNEKSKYPFD
jgi:transcriptional regulator with XRE-family HTH domain